MADCRRKVETQIACHGQSQYECGLLQHRTEQFLQRETKAGARRTIGDFAARGRRASLT